MPYEIGILDYKILAYIYKNGPTNKADIYKKFKFIHKDEIDYRLSSLSGNLLRQETEKQDTVFGDYKFSHHVFKNTYTIAVKGQKVLHDYKAAVKSSNRQLWKAKAVIPIMVSLSVNLLIHGTRWLYPQMLQWLSNVLSRLLLSC